MGETLTSKIIKIYLFFQFREKKRVTFLDTWGLSLGYTDQVSMGDHSP